MGVVGFRREEKIGIKKDDMFKDLLKVLKDASISHGDVLYVPSDITQLMVHARKTMGVNTAEKRNAFLDEFVDTLQEAVGCEGTLLFPIFTWDFNHGLPFDIRNTPGKVGSLPIWILLNRNDFVRTQHPMYSFMMWGKDARHLAEMNNVDCFGQYSPFGYMHRKGAKTLFLNVSVQRGFTFLHYVEESLQVPYRYFKNFKGEYIDVSGSRTLRNYVMYVRDLNITSQEYMPDSFFEERGILKASPWNGVGLKTMSCIDAYNCMKEDFLNNGGRNMYRFEGYEIDWSRGHTHADEIGN